MTRFHYLVLHYFVKCPNALCSHVWGNSSWKSVSLRLMDCNIIFSAKLNLLLKLIRHVFRVQRAGSATNCNAAALQYSLKYIFLHDLHCIISDNMLEVSEAFDKPLKIFHLEEYISKE